jgi:hypothetical protein
MRSPLYLVPASQHSLTFTPLSIPPAPVCVRRVLPQLALTVLALLAPEPFSDSAGSQVAALCTLCGCHVLSVLHARRLFGQYSAATTKAAAAGGPAAGAACAAAIAAVAAGPSGSATLVKKDV